MLLIESKSDEELDHEIRWIIINDPEFQRNVRELIAHNSPINLWLIISALPPKRWIN